MKPKKKNSGRVSQNFCSLIHVASCANNPVIGLYRKATQDISRFGPFLISCELVISKTGEVGDIAVKTISSALIKRVEALYY